MHTQNLPSALSEEKIREEVTYHVALALGEADRNFKERVAAYAEELHRINAQIASLRNEIELVKKSLEPKERVLQVVRNETEAELKYLERLNAQFIRKAEVIAELKNELADIDPNKRKDVLKAKYAILKELRSEIEESEIDLLQKELEAQNLGIELEPARQHLRTLEFQLSELEAQKQYLEGAGTHRLTRRILASDTTAHTDEESGEIIDTQADDSA
jgi:chromosome segregation ATPase